MAMSFALVVPLALALFAGPAQLLDDPEARRLFGEAQGAFEAGDYATASARLEAAYAIEPKPELLYPWAQAERNLDRCRPAIELYQKFLESSPSERMAEAAKQNIARCEERLAALESSEPETAPAATDEEPPPFAVEGDDEDDDDAKGRTDKPPRKGSEKVGIAVGATMLSLGGVGVLAGGTLLGLAAGRARSASDATRQSRYETLRGEAMKLRTGGIVALSIGGALVVGGVIQFAVFAASKKKSKKKADVAMWLDATGGGVVLTRRF